MSSPGDGGPQHGRLLRPADQALVLQSLATMVNAGVPLERALGETARVTTGRTATTLAAVRDRVRQGAGLADAFHTEGGLPASVVGMIRAGERGSGLGRALGEAAHEVEWHTALTREVQAALTYPAVLVLTGATSVLVIAGLVLPRFATLLADLGTSLPPATRVLLAVAQLVQSGWWFMVLGSAAIAGVLVRWIESESGRRRWHAWLLGVPVLGEIRASLASATYVRQLGALLGAGVPMAAALDGARSAVPDRALGARLRRARERVMAGASLSTALGEMHAVTLLTLQLVRVGETSGRLPSLLLQAGEAEASRGRRLLQTAVRLLEPALILLFGVLAAFVAAALLQAVYAVRPGLP